MNQTYLVTGAAGFIGARFVESCNRRGISVISVDRKTHFTERVEHQGIDFGTVVDRDELFDWLARESPPLAAVVHLGACSNTLETDEAFLRRVNVEYSKSLWQHCARAGQRMIYASSAATYGDGAFGYDDDDALTPRLKPLNAYGESKRLFDLWALEQEKSGHSPPVWSGFKFFNVYGFGERHKGRMASVAIHAFDQIQAGGTMKLFKSHREGIADGHQKRDFIFVEDAVEALHFAIEKPVSRGIYNLGTGGARSFLDLATAVFAALGKKPRIEFIETPASLREKYQYFTEARMDRLRGQGFQAPFTALEDGVHAYIRRLELTNAKRPRK